MKLHDVLAIAAEPRMFVELTVKVDGLEFQTSRTADHLCKDMYEELHKREILSFDIVRNKLKLELK